MNTTTKMLFTSLVMLSSTFVFADHHDSKEKMEKLDTNKDGKISETEFDTYKDNKFKKWDKNSDGQIDKDEFEDKMEKHHDKH